ncbi:hypothetical protein ACFQDG_03825 [Natronoarchaeum mannanilyticum]|uniref:SipW-cognate class signal peptide n=1 Tax=Natronoarchaeum mannanilyticum TaxID=926360 RepID=A0AAV3T8K9_9EURY
MSKESKPNITRRNVLAGIGASGAGLALGAHGVAAGEKNYDDKYDVPVAIDWQEAFHKHGEWKKVEAFPDDDNNGVQDDDIDYCDGGVMNDALIGVENPLSADLRTNDDYTSSGDPLINYHGVKPGYGGEVTLSYHICDEPGKLKLEADDVKVDKKLAHLARARVWYDEFDGANNGHNGNNGNNGNNNGDYTDVTGEVDENTSLIDEIYDTRTDEPFDTGNARNFTCDQYDNEEYLGPFDGGELQGEEYFDDDFSEGDMVSGACGTITVISRDTATGSVTLSSDGPVRLVSVKGGNEGEHVYVFSESVILEDATFSTPTGQGISNIDICCTDNGNGNGNGNGKRGDNVYQPYEPIIVQGSLKKVLHKLKKGVHVSGDPYVAGPFDREGIHYYGYPRTNTSDMKTPPAEKYDPGWITDDNVDECVDDKKVKKLKHLDDGVKLCIDGTGYVARNEENPLPDLCIYVKKVITGKKGKPVGFKWKSNLPICRINVASGEHTKLNVFDRATEGTALAPRYGHDNNDNCGCDNNNGHEKHGRRPITGVRFGVCDDHDEDDWCIEDSNTGYIGFEWWLPKHAGLKGKKKFQTNFDFKAKPCDDNNNST